MRLALRRQTYTLLIYICSHSLRLIITNYHHGPPLTTNTKPEPEQRQRPDSLPVKRFCKQLPLPRFHVLRTNSRLTPTDLCASSIKLDYDTEIHNKIDSINTIHDNHDNDNDINNSCLLITIIIITFNVIIYIDIIYNENNYY